ESPSPPADVSPVPTSLGLWMVQLGSFADRVNAEQLRIRLQSDYSVTVQPVSVAGQRLFRVRVGPQLSRAAAETVGRDLERRLGLPGIKVVALDD
ncbi:MAG: SPOR domain-containing protein, partial [Candidatus Competibacterales bacterium]